MSKVRRPPQQAHWDDAHLDTEKPYSIRPAEPAPPASSDSKGNKSSWLRKPTALFSGGSAKRERTPPRADRGFSHPPAPKSNPPPRPPQTLLSPARSGTAASPSSIGAVSARTDAVSPSQESKGGPRVGLSDLPSFGLPVAPGSNQVQTFPGSVQEALDELRRLSLDVKGLHEAFSSLKKEHNELRIELRARQGKSQGGLPVELIASGKQSQTRPKPGDLSSSPRTAAPDTGDRKEPVQNYRPPAHATPTPGDGHFLDGIFESCGFVPEGLHALHNAPEPAQHQTAQSTPSSMPHLSGMSNSSADRLSFGSDRRTPFSNGAHMSLPAPPTLETGSSSASVPQGRPDSRQRGASPHDREGPMESRTSGRKGHSLTGSNSRDNAVPNFGTNAAFTFPSHMDSPTISANRHQQDDLKVPRFGKDDGDRIEPEAVRPPSGTAETMPNTSSAPVSADGTFVAKAPASGAASVTPWKAPQVGEPLVLPFPDVGEDDASDIDNEDTFSPNSSTIRPPSPVPAFKAGTFENLAQASLQDLPPSSQDFPGN